MRTSILTLALALTGTPSIAQPVTPTARPVLIIPKLATVPDLSDFLSMQPSPEVTGVMARVENFVQRWPADGQPERMKTVAYVGYTDEALHVVFLAFDPAPSELRAHLVKREEVFAVNDDEVELRLDTFGDGRQSYYFVSNPLGVQLDASWPEFEGQYDQSFDLVWHSRGQRTSQGFVVAMAIPFRSLRFTAADVQQWGVYFGRWIPRTGEWNFWPPISIRQQSYLAQMARLDGIEDLSRGRGLQLIPYAASRAFAAQETRGQLTSPIRQAFDPSIGLDAKAVIRNAFVLDAAINPDFSQVESDAPQITVNQRFEVFFPEKRPFFLENAGFFHTPINLMFTRRIADPLIGAKLTGKIGAWTIGALASDDEAPGKRVASTDPLAGRDAFAGVARVSRSLFGQSTVGALISDRAFADRRNTVAGFDGRFRLGKVWTADAQYVGSQLATSNGASTRGGSAYQLAVSRNGRTVTSRTSMGGRSPGFTTDLGFVPRVDLQNLVHTSTYVSRPAKALTTWGPTLLVERVWSFAGTPLDWRAQPSIAFNFERSSDVTAFFEASRVTLRPGDAPRVTDALPLRANTWGVTASTSPRPAWSASVQISGGRGINFAPAATTRPSAGDQLTASTTIALRPLTPLRIENTWLRTTLILGGTRAFANDIVRSHWAWQFTREWSLRLIAQYESVRANPSASSLTPKRNLNADVLLTRLVNPWTALYVGYNGNRRDLALVDGRLVPDAGLSTDAWQVFVKWSQLLRW